MTQHIINCSNGMIEYRIEGKGPTIMVLNGGHCSRATRLSHERLVDHGFSVLTPSRPGYDSTSDSVGTTAQDAADSLSELLDLLHIPSVDIIGISAAGPTALAFAQRHAQKVRKLVLESAVTLPWGKEIKFLSHFGFGKAERLTWAFVKLFLKLSPQTATRMMLQQLTTSDAGKVVQTLEKDDILFVQRMIQTSQSGTGFLNDVGHRVDSLEGIVAPTLVLYSRHDKFVPPTHAARIVAEIPTAKLVEVSADTHLIWIGKSADEVWEKRLQFLQS